MKKMLTFLSVVLCLGAWAHAQRNTYFSEDFNVAEDDGTHAMSANWDLKASEVFLRYMRLSKTMSADGEMPEAVIGYYPSNGLQDVLNGTFQLVSNPFTTTGGQAYVTVKYAYTANKRSLKKNRSLSILARRGAGEWVVCATVDSLAQKIPASVLCAALPAEFEQADSIQVALQLQSAKDGVTFIFYLDDVMFSSMPADWFAAEAMVRSDLNVRNGLLDTMMLKLKNVGNPIQGACTLSYRWDAGDTYTQVYDFEDGIGVDASVSLVLKPEGWNPTAWGPHAFEVWVSAIDGATLPEAAVVKHTYTFSNVDEAGMFDKKILVEEFSSATCGPCAGYNRSVFNPTFEALGDSVTLIKYQMNWPGSGDAYYIAEGGARRDYYGVTGVPTLVVEGQTVSPDNDAEKFMAYMHRRMAAAGKTYFNIVFDTVTTVMDCETKRLTVSYTVETKGVLANAKLQTVVMERETTGNVGSNGEKSFHHVMLAMSPGIGADGNTGLSVDLKADTVYTFSYTWDMATTHMEECDDLVVACFIQTEEGGIAQSAVLSLAEDKGTIGNERLTVGGALALYPNPASDIVYLHGLEDAMVELYDLTGRLQFAAQGLNGEYRLSVRDCKPGLYIVKVREGHSVSTAKLQIVR